MEAMKILIVEDAIRLAMSLRAGLRKLGHAVDVVHDGKAGLSYARLNPFDVIVLDLMLPQMHGLDVLSKLREEKVDVPVLVLTAKDTVADRVQGLRRGADDYLIKPFAFEELVARIDSLYRRRRGQPHPKIEIADLVIDTASRQVTRAGRNIQLTQHQYALLLLLAFRKGEIVSRIEIEDKLYSEDTFPMSNVVASSICKLRSQITEPGEANLIHTRRNLGYVLDEVSG